MADSLSAPWRMEYLRTIDKPPSDRCFLCDAVAAADAEERRKRLVLWTSDQCVVLINRFPYTNGHLLIAPKAHEPELQQLNDAQLLDMQVQTAAALRLLRSAMSPQGFNIGINLGRCSGAGVPGHLHQHLVPRWGGDVNFMTAIGEVRVVPQALSRLYDELMAERARMALAGS